MRVESLNLPQAAHNQSKLHGSGKASPGVPAASANEAASSKRPIAENPAADTQKTAKTPPKGLENAISRLEAKDNSTKGTEQALEMLTRNLSRYQVTPPPADTSGTTPAADASTTGSTEAVSSSETLPVSDSTNGSPTSGTT